MSVIIKVTEVTELCEMGSIGDGRWEMGDGKWEMGGDVVCMYPGTKPPYHVPYIVYIPLLPPPPLIP